MFIVILEEEKNRVKGVSPSIAIVKQGHLIAASTSPEK